MTCGAGAELQGHAVSPSLLSAFHFHQGGHQRHQQHDLYLDVNLYLYSFLTLHLCLHLYDNDGSWSMHGGAGFVFGCESVRGICLCTGGPGLREYRNLQMEYPSNILVASDLFCVCCSYS